jgi:hypothetical protein
MLCTLVTAEICAHYRFIALTSSIRTLQSVGCTAATSAQRQPGPPSLRVDQGLQTYSPGESRSVKDDALERGSYSLGIEVGLALLVERPHLEREKKRRKK